MAEAPPVPGEPRTDVVVVDDDDIDDDDNPIYPRTVPYRAYPSRWFVLASAAALSFASNALWVSFAPIANNVSYHYGKSADSVNLLTSIGFVIGLPVSLAGTYLVEHLGLRFVMWGASLTTLIGASLRLVSSLVSMSLDTQFTLLLVSQVFTGLGGPLAFCIPTKVGHVWFPETEAALAGGLVTMSNVGGFALGFSLMPFVVPEPKDVPLVNQIWFGPALLAACLAFFTVTSAQPPTPPSQAAAEIREVTPYWRSMRRLLSNQTFLVLMATGGGAICVSNLIITFLPHWLCSRGYSATFVALCVALLLGVGFVGGAGATLLADKTGRLEEICKAAYGVVSVVGIAMLQLQRMRGISVVMAVMYSLVGLLFTPILPLSFELSFKVIHPVDPAAGLTLIYFAAQVQFAILQVVAPFLTKPLSAELQKSETCTKAGEEALLEAKDYSPFFNVLSVLIACYALGFILLIRTKNIRLH